MAASIRPYRKPGLWFFAAFQAQLNVVETGHQIRDTVDDIVCTTLIHGGIDTVTVLLLYLFGKSIPFIE